MTWTEEEAKLLSGLPYFLKEKYKVVTDGAALPSSIIGNVAVDDVVPPKQSNEYRPLEISPGWTVDQLVTEDDCDKAHSVLSGHIASIEYQLGEHEIDPSRHADNPRWVLRARAALRLKKAAYQSLEFKRRKIRSSIGVHSTVAEIQAEIGRLQALLAGRILGDPTMGVSGEVSMEGLG